MNQSNQLFTNEMKVKAMTIAMFKSWNDKTLGIEDCQMMRLHGKVFKGGFKICVFLTTIQQ